MARGRLARAVHDAGFGWLCQAIEYKAVLQNCRVILADRWFPSTQTCNTCGQLHDMPLGTDTMRYDCGHTVDQDLNAALNLEKYGRLTLLADLERTQGSSKAVPAALALTA